MTNERYLKIEKIIQEVGYPVTSPTYTEYIEAHLFYRHGIQKEEFEEFLTIYTKTS